MNGKETSLRTFFMGMKLVLIVGGMYFTLFEKGVILDS